MSSKAQSPRWLHVHGNRNLAFVLLITIISPFVDQSTLRLRLFRCEGRNIVPRLLLLILIDINPALLRRFTILLLQLSTICGAATVASNSRCLLCCHRKTLGAGSGRFPPSPPYLLILQNFIIVLEFAGDPWLQTDTLSCSELRCRRLVAHI